MTESSNAHVEGRAVVVQKANELSECVRILEELGVPTEIANGTLPTPEQLVGASVIVLPGSRLAESGTPNLSLWPRTIAVVDDASKTMLAHINRLGVALTVRRPIHPRTLRLLLLHEIYRGPERRRKKRILIGHPIKVATGLFTRRATLLELSSGGARIELPSAPKVGSKVKLYLGKDLTLAKPIKLQAKVVRCIGPPSENGRPETELGVALIDPKREAKMIHTILERFATGPASWQGKMDSPAEAVSNAAAPAPRPEKPSETAPAERSLPPTVSNLPPPRAVESPAAPTAPETETALEAETDTTILVEEAAVQEQPVFAMPPPDEMDDFMSSGEAGAIADEVDVQTAPDEAVDADVRTATNDAHANTAADDPDDRRHDARIPYDRRVVALGEEAARVLVGRDLSQGGMRIAASDAVDLGDTLRVALHCGTEIEPLIVLATADRDDGNDGTVLGFHDLTGGQKDHLEKIIASSSPIRSAPNEDDPNGATGSIVLGEMIETIKKGPSRPPDVVETEAQIDAHLDSIFDAD